MALYSDPVVITSGSDASKTSTPSLGMVFQAYDTGKLYCCFRKGFWTCTYTPARESYYNHDGVSTNFLPFVNGMTAGGAITTSSPYGEMILNTGTTGTGDVVATNAVADIIIDAVFPIALNFKLAHNAAIANGTVGGGGACYSYLGYNNNFLAYNAAGQAEALFLQKSDGTWWTRTAADASVAVTENSIAAPVADDILSLLITSKNVVFYKNGTLLFTHTTNLPAAASTGNFGIGLLVLTVAQAVARQVPLQYISIEVYH